MIRKLLTVLGAAALGVAAPFLWAFAQGLTADQVIADACSNNGALLRYVADGLATVGGASLLANLRKVLPASVVPVLDFFAANWWHYLIAQANAAQDAAKKTAPVLLAVIALGALSLSACAPTNPDGSPMTTQQRLAHDLKVTCDLWAADKPSLKTIVHDTLSPDTAAQLDSAGTAADQYCLSPTPPADLEEALIKVQAAVLAAGVAMAEDAKAKDAAATAAPAAPAKP